VVAERTGADSFTEFFTDVQPRLNRALVAALGAQDGVEATQEALVWGWEHWDELCAMDNPAGYLYRVGRSRARRWWRRPKVLPPIRSGEGLPWVEPGLPAALARLSEKQRVCVVLLYTVEFTHAEVADLLGVSVGTVQTHTERGLRKLRRRLGGEP
jgi:RNA polymerase sigma-70 factor (ECF subfamily)